MTVKICKLITGEEIIANVEYCEEEIILEDPAKIMLFPTEEENGMAMALLPWLPYTEDKKISIKKDAIIVIVKPTTNILNQYNEQFGSGLIVPPSDIMID